MPLVASVAGAHVKRICPALGAAVIAELVGKSRSKVMSSETGDEMLPALSRYQTRTVFGPVPADKFQTSEVTGLIQVAHVVLLLRQIAPIPPASTAGVIA